MKAMQSALNFIIKMQGITVQIKEMSTDTSYDVLAAQSNYFRKPLIDEQITGSGRSYVISARDLEFVPKRGDRFLVTSTEYYSISQVDEMRAFGEILGYRLYLE